MPSVKPSRLRLCDRAALAILVLWTVYDATAVNLFGPKPAGERSVDYHLLYQYSHTVVSSHHYPPWYPYPPPSIVLQYISALPPITIAVHIYLVLTIAAALACWLLLRQMLFDSDGRPGWAILLPAVFASNYFVQWDLRSQNCNILVLACLLLGMRELQLGKPAQSGLWLSAGIALKVYPVVLIPYLLWKREHAALAWLLAFSAVMWLVLPMIAFTPRGAADVYAGWFAQMANAAHALTLSPRHPILISLQRSAETLLPGRASWILNGARLAWAGLLFAGLDASRRRGAPRREASHASAAGSTRMAKADCIGMLTDVSLLLLAPIALSPYLEPYHEAPFALAAALLVDAGTDVTLTARWRAAAWLTLALSYLAIAVRTPFAVRGLAVNIELFIALAGLLAISRHRTPLCSDRPPEQQAPAATPVPEAPRA